MRYIIIINKNNFINKIYIKKIDFYNKYIINILRTY